MTGGEFESGNQHPALGKVLLESSAGSYAGLSGLNYNPENGAPARFEL
jgi:hypothetical protein